MPETQFCDQRTETTTGTVAVVEIGYARVSTTRQDLERQVHALEAVGIEAERIFVDKKSGTTTDRPGLRAALGYAREGDVLVVRTLDRLGRTVRDTPNLIHDLAQHGVGVRNLADPITVDSSNPSDPMAQLAVVLLALFAQMERTYNAERAAHACSVAVAKGRRVGRPVRRPRQDRLGGCAAPAGSPRWPRRRRAAWVPRRSTGPGCAQPRSASWPLSIYPTPARRG